MNVITNYLRKKINGLHAFTVYSKIESRVLITVVLTLRPLRDFIGFFGYQPPLI
jgi:hypothetical protein